MCAKSMYHCRVRELTNACVSRVKDFIFARVVHDPILERAIYPSGIPKKEMGEYM